MMMTGWQFFALAFLVFFLTHTISVQPRVKAQLQSYLGQRGFTTVYSILSLAVLGLLIFAAKNAPYIEIWPHTNWQHHVVLIGMFVVCLIAALAIARPNPFSFGGAQNDNFDPAHPGIVRFTRHPLLAALALWAALHLLPNGDLAHVIMFGVFLGFALLGRWIIDRRKKRLMGAARWNDLLRRTKQAPIFAGAIPARSMVLRVSIAVASFGILIALHPLVIGVYPLPW